MAPERDPSELTHLWRKQPTEDATVSLDIIHDRAQAFQSQIRRRNLREYFAALVVVVGFGRYLWIYPGWMAKAGSALSIIAALFVMWQLHRRGGSQPLPGESGMSIVDFHRAELIRQRDLLKSVGSWYLAPFVPGLILLMMGRYFQIHAPGRTLAADHRVILVGTGVVFLVLGAVWLVNRRAADRLQRKIDQLEGLQ
jgi:Flp pilus assembly protein TadB